MEIYSNKSKTKFLEQVSYLITTEQGKFVTDEKALVLNTAFSSVFTKGGCRPITYSLHASSTTSTLDEPVTEEVIFFLIKKLKENKAWGPDDVHRKLLK